jgi:hypothetical protein
MFRKREQTYPVNQASMDRLRENIGRQIVVVYLQGGSQSTFISTLKGVEDFRYIRVGGNAGGEQKIDFVSEDYLIKSIYSVRLHATKDPTKISLYENSIITEKLRDELQANESLLTPDLVRKLKEQSFGENMSDRLGVLDRLRQ